MPPPDDHQVCTWAVLLWCFQSSSFSDLFEPPEEGKGIGFPRKHVILADCTTWGEGWLFMCVCRERDIKRGRVVHHCISTTSLRFWRGGVLAYRTSELRRLDIKHVQKGTRLSWPCCQCARAACAAVLMLVLVCACAIGMQACSLCVHT